MSPRVLLALPCLFAVAARAQPLTLPTRDVDVTYQMPRPGAPPGEAPLSQRMRWDVDAQKLRVDPPRPGLYLVVDYRAHTLSAVRAAERLVLQIPSAQAGIAQQALPGLADGKGFTRADDATVASLRCTEWRTTDAAGEGSVICLTNDGVLLRARVGDQVLIQATNVAYGALDPAVFAVPDDFRRVGPGSEPKGSAPQEAKQ